MREGQGIIMMPPTHSSGVLGDGVWEKLIERVLYVIVFRKSAEKEAGLWTNSVCQSKMQKLVVQCRHLGLNELERSGSVLMTEGLTVLLDSELSLMTVWSVFGTCFQWLIGERWRTNKHSKRRSGATFIERKDKTNYKLSSFNFLLSLPLFFPFSFSSSNIYYKNTKFYA